MARSESPIKKGLSFNNLQSFEQTCPRKHEFVDEQLFIMAGASESHNRLVGRFYAFLLAAELELIVQSLYTNL